MIKHLSCTLFFICLINTASFSQDSPKFQNLPKSTQVAFNKIAAKYRTGPVDYRVVENDVRKNAVDFSNMPIEDAIQMLFMLIADDARKDTKEMLSEMDAKRKKRAALRESEELMKKELDALKKETETLRLRDPNKYRIDSLVTAKHLNQKMQQLQQITVQKKEALAAEGKATAAKIAAEIHLRSAEEALIKVQQIKSGRKSQ